MQDAKGVYKNTDTEGNYLCSTKAGIMICNVVVPWEDSSHIDGQVIGLESSGERG